MGTNFVNVAIGNHGQVNVKIQDEPKHIHVTLPTKTTIVERIKDADLYDGEYQVVSDVDEIQVLNTKNKIMKDDVTILAIPYWEVSNDTGTTCVIGKESELYGL